MYLRFNNIIRLATALALEPAEQQPFDEIGYWKNVFGGQVPEAALVFWDAQGVKRLLVAAHAGPVEDMLEHVINQMAQGIQVIDAHALRREFTEKVLAGRKAWEPYAEIAEDDIPF